MGQHFSKAPWTDEEVVALNAYQDNGRYKCFHGGYVLIAIIPKTGRIDLCSNPFRYEDLC